MNTSEFAAHKPFVDAQFSKIGLPAAAELNDGIGGEFYVKDYIRADGTRVKGYYRRR